MLDMLGILETHKAVMESQCRLQQAACGHSLHILDAGAPPSTEPHGWFNHMRNSMRKSAYKPARPPPPLGPHTFYANDRLPTGESPAILPVTSSTTAQFPRKVTVTDDGALQVTIPGNGGETGAQEDEVNSTTNLMSLTESEDEEADTRLTQARLLQTVETSSSLASDSRFASLSRRGRKGTFGRDSTREGIQMQEIQATVHQAEAPLPPALPPPPSTRNDLASELKQRRQKMGLPDNIE